ncbi:hypothetical protein BDN72DRAFT_559429 [Pluteus cervinus]|uniref:Uncharacterized protein n=1 Tax=Pluteus cervinus TaxID=181527 RepID=A0ACD3B9Y1_9AGAR|nr:hypothetical protein BDN72DRAFT_559429 [Pluteus cervinus]
MPLPDERPRASVANLIGRFELQTKKPPASTPPRSTSVASQITGDSAKEELREKREWPPRPSTVDKSPVVVPTYSHWSRPTPPASQPASPPTGVTEVPPQIIPSVSTETAASTTSEVSSEAHSILDPPSPPPEEVAPLVKPVTPPPPPPPAVAAAAEPVAAITKAPTSNPTRTIVKPAAKSPRPSAGTTAQPLKPQHTGTSTTSSARKPVSISKPGPSTPARPKTPSRASINATSTARPKTPSTRPKTPSGLFAPTAASLAKARNAPPVPGPPKKMITSTSMDRLSKPTAASLSRMRTPPPGATPSHTSPKSAARGGAPTRGTPRSSIAGAPTRAKKELSKPAAKGSPTSKPASKPTSTTSGKPEEVAHNVVEESESHHADDDLHDESVIVYSHQESDTSTKVADVGEPTLQINGSEKALGDLAPSPQEPPHVDELEAMINLLEVSKARPKSFLVIPDEVHDIPDED